MKRSTMYQYQTVLEALQEAELNGYQHNLKIENNGIVALEIERWYPPQKLIINQTYRIEGLSDPEDEAIVYAISTEDGIKGTLVETYGPLADPAHSALLKKIKVDETISIS